MSTSDMTPGKFIAVLVCGALFGFGLALSTMVQPEVVLSFLRFQDFGLMLVMGGAVLVADAALHHWLDEIGAACVVLRPDRY